MLEWEMPSVITHITIAKRFLEKHSNLIKNVQDFLDGNVLPDLASDKAVSHCGVRKEMLDIVKYNAEKVNPDKFVATHDMTSDLNKGQFLHLYVDNQYYNVFLGEYLKRQTSGMQVSNDMYEVTCRDEVYLRVKYRVEYTDTSYALQLRANMDEWNQEKAIERVRQDYQFTIPYTLNDLDMFIEEMSNVKIPEK